MGDPRRRPAWRSSRAGHWSCTCRAGSPPTSATRCAPPGRSPGLDTRCCTTRCTCSTPTPSTPTRSASPSPIRCSATARRRSSAMAPSPRWSATTCCSCGSGRSASSASYLLARELGLRWIGAATAAAAFAYAPYRVTEAGHFQVISSGGLALGLFLLLRGYRRDSRKLVLAGWLVSAWQVSLGFTLGLQFTYLLARTRAARARALVVRAPDPGLSLGKSGAARRRRLPRVLWRDPCLPIGYAPAKRSSAAVRERSHHLSVGPARGARPADPTPAAGGDADRDRRARCRRRLSGAPYLKVANEYPTAKRTIKEVETYSSGPAALVRRLLGEPRLGRHHLGRARESAFEERGRVLPRWPRARARADRPDRRLDLHAPITPRPGARDPHLLDPRARPRLDRRRLSLPPAVRLRPGLERRARAGQDLHAGDAPLRAARRRGRATAGRDSGRLGRPDTPCARCPGSSAWCS